MVVGAGKIRFRIYDVRSLKEKRKILKSIINRIKTKFNISIAETGMNDNYGWCEIGFSVTGNDRQQINSTMDKVIEMADNMGLAQITQTDIEIINY